MATEETDPFAHAFEQLSNEEAKEPEGTADQGQGAAGATGATGPADQGQGATGATGAVDDGGLPDPANVPAQGATGATGAADPGQGATGATGTTGEAPLTNDELVARFREMAKARPAEPAVAAEPERPAAAAPAISPYTADEQRLVDAYKAEWPDVYAAEQAIRAREYQGLVAHIFDTIRPVLEQLQSQTGAIVEQTYEQQLLTRVPDYVEVAPKVVDWIKTQPTFVKNAYEAVAKGGTVDEVVTLIGLYRAATGTPAPKPALAVVPGAPAPAAPPADPTRAAAVKGLAPVASKRSSVQTGGVAPDDFDGAFEQASKAAGL